MKRITARLIICAMLISCAYSLNNTNSHARTKSYTRYVRIQALEVHKKKSVSSKVVATLKLNKKITQVGSSSNGWSKIKYKSGNFGYVETKGIAKHPDVEIVRNASYKRLCKAAQIYGWTLESGIPKGEGEQDDFKSGYLHSSCWFKNSKYKISILFWGYDFNSVNNIHTYSIVRNNKNSDDLKEIVDAYRTDETIDRLFIKYAKGYSLPIEAPKKVSGISVKNAKTKKTKNFERHYNYVSWDKVDGADGYEIATNGIIDNTLYPDYKGVKGNKTKLLIKEYERNNCNVWDEYVNVRKFKIRAYKYYDGIKIYGSWSKVSKTKK